MNKHLEDAVTRLKSLPEDRQNEAAALLFEFLEIERRLSDGEPYASDAEVRATFDRLTK